MNITLKELHNVIDHLKQNDEWKSDMQSESEYHGVLMGLNMIVSHFDKLKVMQILYQQTFKVDVADTYNQEHHKWEENYYTNPKVTHPSIKIDVPIPKEWVSSSYSNDLCPSFTHKVYQIFVMDEQTRIEEESSHKYSVMLQDDYGGGYDSLITSNDWFEVIEFVNNNGEKTNADN